MFRGNLDLDGTDRMGVQFINDLYVCGVGDRNPYVDALIVNDDTNGRDQGFFSAGTAYWDI